MSGFNNTPQAKQFGPILRGLGEPNPAAGVLGDVYIDSQTFLLYERRGGGKANPWGNYIFLVPLTYQATLKWFSASRPGNDIGVNGDYCLMWGGYPNYGVQPSILGPKAAGAWPANPVNVAVVLSPTYTADNEHAI